MVEKTVSLDTVLGRLLVSASCPASEPTQVELSLDVVDVRSALPPGMSVLRRRAVVLRLAAADDVPVLVWTCTLLGDAIGSGNNGEGLLAEEWEGAGFLVTVGTEDDRYLASRCPFLGPEEDPGFATYSTNRLDVRVLSIPPSTPLTLHYVVAENPLPEPVAASNWFAVDVPHAAIASLL